MRTVAVLAYDGVQLLDVAGPVEVFEAARGRGADYRLLVASPDGRDSHAGRARIGADAAFAQLPDPLDTVVVPGAPACADRALVAAVAHVTERGRRVVGGIDSCLALVAADHGSELARDVARELAVSGEPARPALAVTRCPTLRRVLDGVSAQPAGDHSLEALSERAGFSARHLSRVFRRELGLTPGRYVERVRVEAAKARLQRGDEPLAAVARAVGFGSEETMRRAFRREAVTTPADYRNRFRTVDAVGAVRA